MLHSSNRIVNEIYNGKELVFVIVGSNDSILLGNCMCTDGQQGFEEALVEVVVGIKSALTSDQFR